MFLPWIYLATAISSEVAATVVLRYSDGFTNPVPSVGAIAGYAISIWLLGLTVRELDVSLVYAVWAGIGTAAIAVIGMTALGEPVNAMKIASIGLVITGVVGLNVAGAS